MSDEVERRLLDVLGNPTTSPFGNPIPALAELLPEVAPATPDDEAAELTLLAAAETRPRQVTVLRIEESAQADESAVATFGSAGLLVGAVVTCRRKDDRVLIGGPTNFVEIGGPTAGHVWVRTERDNGRGATEGEQNDAAG